MWSSIYVCPAVRYDHPWDDFHETNARRQLVRTELLYQISWRSDKQFSRWQYVQQRRLDGQTWSAQHTRRSFFYFGKNAWPSIREKKTPLATAAAQSATAAMSSCSGHSDMEFCCSKKRNGVTWWLTVDTRRCWRFRLSPAELLTPEVSAERCACIHVA